MSESAHLELDRVSKVFPRQGGGGEVRAVDGVSLAIRRGEFVTLLGPSGCGKTTTLRMIAGFELPTAGRILLAGRDITDQPANRRDMAMVFQSYALFPHLSVAENVAYGLEARGAPRAEIRGRVEKALALMGLEGLAGRRPAQLSGGQQQRVALARCLVLEPSVLLFDEPLSNLDAKLRVQMRTEILALQRRLNITSVYVTHDQAEAMVLSDRIVVMHAGRIEQIGSPREIYRRPASRFVADFIGRANFVPTRVEVVAGGLALVTLLGREARVPASDGLRPGDAATAVLRPEALRLLPKPSGAAGRVEQAMYMGAAVDYVVSLDGALLMVTESDPRGERAFVEGQPVGVDFEPAAVHLLPGAD